MIDDELDGLGKLIAAFSPLVENLKIVLWDRKVILPLLYRAMIERQFSTLAIIRWGAQEGYANALVSLLRQSCEELIWAKYLSSKPPDISEALVGILMANETTDAIKAQRGAVGDPKLHEWGFSPDFLTNISKNSATATDTLQQIGEALRWKKRADEPYRVPSLSWLATEVEERETYDLLYHAASRTVHFSVNHLLRRAWGNRVDEVEISGKWLETYWAAFLLCYCARLFVATTIASGEGLKELGIGVDIPEAPFEALKLIGSRVPIILREEFNL